MIKTDNTLKPFCMMILDIISAVILSLTARYGHILWITTTNLVFQKERYVGIETIITGGVSLNTFHVHEQIWVQMLTF